MRARVRAMVSLEMERDVLIDPARPFSLEQLVKSDLEGEGWKVLDLTVLTTGIGQAKNKLSDVEGF